MHSKESPASLACACEQAVFHAGETGQVWRVVQGLVRLDRKGSHGRHPVQIAVAGDLIGTEALCNQAFRFNATALTPCLLEAVSVGDAQAQAALLQQALMQQQLRSQDMAALRTGTVLQRIAHFLHMLGFEWATAAQLRNTEAIRAALPTLREVAQVVDAKTETVCRVLGQLMPTRRRKIAIA
ncbi:MAG: cyclic nucleotide-binding domain-containing protein [Hydrogenophaga sp.]